MSIYRVIYRQNGTVYKATQWTTFKAVALALLTNGGTLEVSKL